MNLREAEALIIKLEAAQCVGDMHFVARRMPELEEAIALLTDLNYRLAGHDAANALVGTLQHRARLVRQRQRS